MSEEKVQFVKAKCKKTGRYFGLITEKLGSAWKVTNMINLTDEEGKLVASQLRETSLVSNDNLLACLTCGSRRVGGCSCAKSRSCSKDMKYQLACLYCSELEIDLSRPRGGVGFKKGDTIKLEQNQEIPICFEDESPLDHILVRTGWDPARRGNNMDVDSSVVVVGSSGRELVYFGHLFHLSGCVEHHGDNLTGDGDGDDELIDVYLDRVPYDRDRIYFVLNVFSGQNLNDVRNLYIQLCDPVSGAVLASYDTPQGGREDTAMILGLARRTENGWTFKAMGNSLDADVHLLETLCTNYT